MKNTLTGTIATLSTMTPEIANSINPEIITTSSSLIVQVVTAIIALISFFKSLKKKQA